jgi:cytochrome c biogenesis factor
MFYGSLIKNATLKMARINRVQLPYTYHLRLDQEPDTCSNQHSWYSTLKSLNPTSQVLHLLRCKINLGLHQYKLASLINILLGHLILFILFTSNPFLPIYSLFYFNNLELNPILQDIGLIIHPPILYLGYVGILFIFILYKTIQYWLDEKGLIVNNYEKFNIQYNITPTNTNHYVVGRSVWLGVAGVPSELLKYELGNPQHRSEDNDFRKLMKLLHNSILIPWIFLTLGILLGSWWAYYELGWGGWWFWDPVENIALLPWIFLTLLYHNWWVNPHNKWDRPLQFGRIDSKGIYSEYNNLTLKFLVYFTFVSALFGSFLIRIGIFNSVHSFAYDQTKSLFLIIILGQLSYLFWQRNV